MVQRTICSRGCPALELREDAPDRPLAPLAPIVDRRVDDVRSPEHRLDQCHAVEIVRGVVTLPEVRSYPDARRLKALDLPKVPGRDSRFNASLRKASVPPGVDPVNRGLPGELVHHHSGAQLLLRWARFGRACSLRRPRRSSPRSEWCWCCGCLRAGSRRGPRGRRAFRARCCRDPAARPTISAPCRVAARSVSMGVSPAAGEGPHLPVVAEPLELAVASDTHAALRRGRSSPPGPRSSGRRARPRGTRDASGVLESMRLCGQEAVQLFVVVHLGRGVVVVLGERTSVGDEERRRVAHPGLRHELDDVSVERHDGKAVLVAAEPVEDVGEVQLQVEAPSVVGIISSSFAACTTNWRCLRFPTM